MTDLPETMTAVLQTGDGYSGQATGPVIENAADYLETARIPVPEPGPGQVLIRLRMASVNPSDLHFIKGEYGQPRVRGQPAGFEGCGDVVAAGDQAMGLVGRRVAFVAGGAWAEYVRTDATMCVPLRPDISDTDGAAQIVNPLTAMAMVNLARADGDAFVISAATSQLGKLMCALGRDLGMRPIALVRRAAAVQAMSDLGAARVLDITAPDLSTQIAGVCADLRPRVFLDAVSDQISERVFSAMPPGARWIVYGKLSSEAPRLTQMGQFIFMDKRIEGFWLTNWMRQASDADRVAAATEVQARFADGRWRTDMSRRLSLDQVVPELAEALKLPDGKVMITP